MNEIQSISLTGANVPPVNLGADLLRIAGMVLKILNSTQTGPMA